MERRVFWYYTYYCVSCTNTEMGTGTDGDRLKVINNLCTDYAWNCHHTPKCLSVTIQLGAPSEYKFCQLSNINQDVLYIGLHSFVPYTVEFLMGLQIKAASGPNLELKPDFEPKLSELINTEPKHDRIWKIKWLELTRKCCAIYMFVLMFPHKAINATSPSTLSLYLKQ